jgi:hypothetical protein
MNILLDVPESLVEWADALLAKRMVDYLTAKRPKQKRAPGRPRKYGPKRKATPQELAKAEVIAAAKGASAANAYLASVQRGEPLPTPKVGEADEDDARGPKPSRRKILLEAILVGQKLVK